MQALHEQLFQFMRSHGWCRKIALGGTVHSDNNDRTPVRDIVCLFETFHIVAMEFLLIRKGNPWAKETKFSLFMVTG